MMRRHLTRLTTAVTGGAALVLLAGVSAAAAGQAAAARPAAAAHSGWGKAGKIPGTGTLNLGGDADATAISCSSAGNCVTGGLYADAMRHDQVFLAVESKGRWGKAFEIPGTASLNGDGDGEVAAVSCPSAGACAATGTYEAASGAIEAFVVAEHQGHWAKAAEVRGFGSLNTGGFGDVTSISCAAAGYCTLGGSYLDGSDRFQAFLATEAKGHWAAAVKVPGIASLNAAGHAEVSDLSCRKPGYCTAGGFTERSKDGYTAFVLSESKGHWGKAQRLPGMSGLNHGGSAGVDALSCASAGNCVTGGSYRPSPGSTHSQAYLAVQENGHWGSAAEVPGTASLNKGGGAQITAASCPAAGACAAGGFYLNSSGHVELFLVSQHNGHWGKAGNMPGLLALNKGSSSQVYSLSCSSAGNCSGGGYYENSSFREFAYVITESGGHWGKTQPVPGITSLSPGGDSDVNQVSCPSAGYCAAAGTGHDGSHLGLAFVASRT
jgi:hypothetical protein